MAKYRKKPVVIEATQWRKPGDHPEVRSSRNGLPLPEGSFTLDEGEVVGFIETLEGPHVVRPGDWIITGVAGEHYPCRPDIFAATYDPAE